MCKVPIILSRVKCKLESSRKIFSKSPLVQNISKFRLVGAEVTHADGNRQTDIRKDITRLIVAFS